MKKAKKDKQDYIKELIQFTNDRMVEHVVDEICTKTPFESRQGFIDAAIKLGMKPDDTFRGTPLLHYAVGQNDLISCSHLMKHGADVNIKSARGRNVLHICSQKPLMKLFLDKNVNINHQDLNGDTPLIAAVENKHIDCAKLLLERKADINIKNSADKTVFHVVLEKEKLDLDILKTIINLKEKLNKKDLRYISRLKNLEALKIIVEKFSGCINRYINDANMTLFSCFIKEDNKDIIKYLLTKHIDFYKFNKNNQTYLHLMADNLDVENIETLLEKNNKIINHKCCCGKTALDYAVNSENDNEDKLIRIIKLLTKHGIDANSRTELDFRALEVAIQRHSEKVIEAVIDAGTDLKLERVRKSINDSKTNNDPVSFAVVVNKIDALKLLIRKGAVLHKKRAHTALLTAISFSRVDCVDYLLELPEIKDVTLNKYLSAFAKKSGCGSDIVGKFTTITEHFNINKVRHYETKIKRLSINYNSNRIDILKNIYMVLIILQQVITFRHIKEIYDIFVSFDNMVNIIAPHISKINKSINLIGALINDFNPEHIQELVESLRYVQEMFDDDELTSEKAKEKIIELKNMLHEEEAIKIIELYRVVKFILTEIYGCSVCPCCLVSETVSDCEYSDSDSEDEDEEEDSCDSEEDSCDSEEPEEAPKIEPEKVTIPEITIPKEEQVTLIPVHHKKPYYYPNVRKNIRRLLFKLSWPEKLPHYDLMYDLLTNKTDSFIQNQDDTATVLNSDRQVVATIYSHPDWRKPSRWFQFYGSHIMEKKRDENHAFPFVMDSKLLHWPCLEKGARDTTTVNESNVLLYFLGEYNGVLGIFEYFINSSGTLFHRMFRHYDAVPLTIKKCIPRDIYKRY
jgi:ankyrin repeat protein